MARPSVTFYGGVKEIGGNMFLVEDKGTRVFLDFGMPMGRAGNYFWDYIQPRDFNGMGDLMEFGLLPRVEGIYRRDFSKHSGFGDDRAETSVDAVLLSHAHVDHVGYVNYLRPEIPVYCSEATRLIVQALDDSSNYGYLSYQEMFRAYVNKQGAMSRARSSENREEVPRKVEVFTPGKPFAVGSIEVEPVPIDHSLPGVSGFILHTSAGSLACTADIRFHGRRRKESEGFVERCAKSELDVLLCEGTRVDRVGSSTEMDVEQGVEKVIADTKGLVVATYPVRDLDRLLSFYRASVAANRDLVVDVRQAHILDLFAESEAAKGKYPEADGKRVKVYLPRKGWGLLGKKGDWDDKLKAEDYRQLEREVFESGDYVDYEYVRAHQRDSVFFLSDYRLQELIDVRPVPGSAYVRSTTEPFDLEQEENEKKIRGWTEHFGLKWTLERLHVSGHGDQTQIRKVVEGAEADKLIPVHTVHEEMFKGWHDDVQLVSLNQRVEL